MEESQGEREGFGLERVMVWKIESLRVRSIHLTSSCANGYSWEK